MAMSPRLMRPRAIPTTAPGFDVTSLPGLVSWWDASAANSLYQNSDGTTASVADGDAVGYWKDLYGTNHIIQATANNRPFYKPSGLNSKKAVLFDGVNDALRATPSAAVGANELTVFAVWAVATAGTYISAPLVLGSGSSARPFDRWQSAGSNLAYVGSSFATATVGLRTRTTPIVYRIEVIKDGFASGHHSFDEYINSSGSGNYIVVSTYSTTSQVISVGGRADGATASNIYVSELILIDGLLSESEVDETMTYLADKWGITL